MRRIDAWNPWLQEAVLARQAVWAASAVFSSGPQDAVHPASCESAMNHLGAALLPCDCSQRELLQPVAQLGASQQRDRSLVDISPIEVLVS